MIVAIVGFIMSIWVVKLILKYLGIDITTIQDITVYDVMTQILQKLFGKNGNHESEIKEFLQKIKIYIALCQILSSLVIVFNAVPPINFSRVILVFSTLVSNYDLYCCKRLWYDKSLFFML